MTAFCKSRQRRYPYRRLLLAAGCRFRVTQKRRIATALLSCSEDRANRLLFRYLLCFFLPATTAVPMAALPLTSIRTTNRAGLLVSPVCGMML